VALFLPFIQGGGKKEPISEDARKKRGEKGGKIDYIYRSCTGFSNHFLSTRVDSVQGKKELRKRRPLEMVKEKEGLKALTLFLLAWEKKRAGKGAAARGRR